MKCEIIRDLLPLYLDGLTSEESNEAVREHLNGCGSCKGILDEMKQETEMKPKEMKRKINPFRKFDRKMKGTVAAVLAVCVALGSFGYKAFGRGFAIDPNEITMDVRLDEDMLYLDFVLEEGVLQHYGTMYDNTSASIDLRKVWTLPGDYLGTEPNRFSWGVSLDLLTMGTGERLEVQLIDGGLAVVETTDDEGVEIQNGDAGPLAMTVFHEGDEAVSIALGDGAAEIPQDYQFHIHYGRDTQTYTLEELLDMCQ